uniref:Uncharacterized protein n=2 Tax=viral metagenome TaxID=1070528 RepID=A0A6M3Y000_9ZZZZ
MGGRVMTREEFWEKWNPCDCAEWGYTDWTNNHELCKEEMFKDLDALSECNCLSKKSLPGHIIQG